MKKDKILLLSQLLDFCVTSKGANFPSRGKPIQGLHVQASAPEKTLLIFKEDTAREKNWGTELLYQFLFNI